MLRAKHGCPEVELDMQASALAQDRARNMAKTGTLTHWAADGTKPYHAYFDGGVAAHVEESIWGKEEVRTTLAGMGRCSRPPTTIDLTSPHLTYRPTNTPTNTPTNPPNRLATLIRWTL